jgi:HAD superfamily hydrolase (TIGR01490 family)
MGSLSFQEKQMTQPLAIFDLDGTLVSCQTQRCLLEQCMKRGYIGTFAHARLLLWFGLYKTGLVSKPRRAMEYAYRFAAGWSVEQLEQEIVDCVEHLILPHLNLKMTERVEEERRHGRHLLLVSNSISPMVAVIAKHLRLDGYIGTRLEMIDNHYTGRIAGAIAYENEKVSLVKEYAGNNRLSLSDSVVYGDHISDLPLLEAASKAVAVSPCLKLQTIAMKRNWEIVTS